MLFLFSQCIVQKDAEVALDDVELARRHGGRRGKIIDHVWAGFNVVWRECLRTDGYGLQKVIDGVQSSFRRGIDLPCVPRTPRLSSRPQGWRDRSGRVLARAEVRVGRYPIR
jgi:hypothetical protein